MARAKKTSSTQPHSASPSSLVKAAAKAQKARDRLGSDNVKAAVTLSGAASLFTNIYIAMGFFMRLAEKPLGEAEQRALESRGREFFGKLGVNEDLSDPGTQTEVVVSVPFNQLERLDVLYALGLKGSARSVARGFLELRGAADIDRLTPLVADMGGQISIIERPPAPVAAETSAAGPAAEPNGVATLVAEPQTAAVGSTGATIAPQPESNPSATASQSEPPGGEAVADAGGTTPASAKIIEAVTAVLTNKDPEKTETNPVPPFLRQDRAGSSSQAFSAATRPAPVFKPAARPIVPPNPFAKPPGTAGSR
jgi:hypothetical protein